MQEISEERLEKAKQDALVFFNGNREIHSSCLGIIKIKPEGFNHMIWERKNHKRNTRDMYVRFLCFRHIGTILERVGLCQEYKTEMESTRVKRAGKIIHQKQQVEYFAFVAVLFDNLRVKVVIKKTDGWGKSEFISVSPAWKTEGYNDLKFKTLFYEETLEGETEKKIEIGKNSSQKSQLK